MIIIDISGAEVQAALDTAIAESNDLPFADIAYDKAQAAVAALRPKADSLIKAVRAAAPCPTLHQGQSPCRGEKAAHNANAKHRSASRRLLALGAATTKGKEARNFPHMFPLNPFRAFSPLHHRF